jgi:hypothetical protein
MDDLATEICNPKSLASAAERLAGKSCYKKIDARSLGVEGG